MDSVRTIRFFLFTLLVACARLAAQNVDPTAVTITYNGSSGATTGTVTVTNATNVSARIGTNLDSTGALVSSAVNTGGVFLFNISSGGNGASIFIGTEPNTLGALARRGANSYTGATLLISADGCTDCRSVALTLQITSGGTVSITYNGAQIPSTGIALFATAGGVTSAIVTLTSTNPTAFQAASNQTWLQVNPTVGQLTGSQNIQLTANSVGLPNGPNQATLTISAGGITTSITVTLNVGTGGGISLNPNPMNFSYVTSTASFPSGQTQFLSISGASASATYTASAVSTPQWLLVGSGGGSSVSGLPVSSQLPVSVNPAVLNLSTVATYQGTVTIQTSDGLSATLNVNLSVSTTGGGGSSGLTFNVAVPGSAAPPAQQISISGSGPYSAFAGVNNCGQGWLQVSPASGQLSAIPTTLTVQVFPGSIGAGTCTGTISLSTTGFFTGGNNFQSVNITMTIGGGTGGTGPVVSPASLTFTLPPGGTQSQSVIVNGSGDSYTAQAIGTNLTVFPTSGTTPAVLTVTANSSSSSGSITITSPLGAQNVGVTVNVLAGNVLTANPASLAFIYQTGTTLPVQNIAVSASLDSTGTNLAYTVSSAPSFVSYAVTSGTTPSSIGVGINTSQLAPGYNSGNIVLTANGAANPSLTIPVTVLAPGTTQSLTASPNPVSLSAQQFGGPVNQTVSLSGISGTTFTASTISTGNWLMVSPNSGTIPATLTLTASPLTLTAQATPYNGTVTVTANNGTSLTIAVSLTVSTTGATNPVLSVVPTTVTFNYRAGDPAPAAQNVQISSTNGSTTFSATTTAPWISLSPASGSTPSSLSISLNTSLLSQGAQTGTITITAPAASGSPQTITVTANVSAAPALTLSTTSTAFSYRTGDPAPPSQTVQVSSGGPTLPFTVSVSNAPWLTVTPTSGTTPATITLAADPSRVQVGTYSATLTFNAMGATSQTITVALSVTAPLPTISEVHNGASNQTGPIAPGLIIVITGTDLGQDPLTQYTVNGDLFATTITNTRVLVGGFAAPMIYASSTQLAAIVPYEIAGRTSTFVQVEYLGQRSNAATVTVANTAPGIFTLNSTGTGPGAILNQDGSVNSAGNPESVNRSIVLFATGEGQTIPGGINGKLADEAVLPKPVLQVTASINNVPAEVQYYGAAPGLVAGVMQVNILVPPGATSGDIVLHIGGNDSQRGVTVAIR